jgi:hypothetical protein
MDTSNESLRQGHRLLQAGILLLLFALIMGLDVPKFAVPRLGPQLAGVSTRAGNLTFVPASTTFLAIPEANNGGCR